MRRLPAVFLYGCVAIFAALLACGVQDVLVSVVHAFQQPVTQPDTTAQPAKASEMKLSGEELRSITDLLKDKELAEIKMQLLIIQRGNLAMQEQLLQPDLQKKQQSAVHRWAEICKERKLDPAKWILNQQTGEIVPVPQPR